MGKSIAILLLLTTLNGLSQNDNKIVGLYKFDDGFYQFILKIRPDSTFELFNLTTENISGKWSYERDTLYVETLLRNPLVERTDESRTNRIIRVRTSQGFSKKTILMFNGEAMAKTTDNNGNLTINIDTLKSIKVLEGNSPNYTISSNEINDITIYLPESKKSGDLVFNQIFKEKWAVKNNRIFAWTNRKGIINNERFYFERVKKKERKYYEEFIEEPMHNSK